MEADILPIDDPDGAKADLVDGVLGEDSLFHETHGYYAQGVDPSTALLPDAWQDRVVPLSNANTRGVTGLCLEPHDLAIAKVAAARPKDYTFVEALVMAGLLDPTVLRERLRVTSLDSHRRDQSTAFLDRLVEPG